MSTTKNVRVAAAVSPATSATVAASAPSAAAPGRRDDREAHAHGRRTGVDDGDEVLPHLRGGQPGGVRRARQLRREVDGDDPPGAGGQAPAVGGDEVPRGGPGGRDGLAAHREGPGDVLGADLAPLPPGAAGEHDVERHDLDVVLLEDRGGKVGRRIGDDGDGHPARLARRRVDQREPTRAAASPSAVAGATAGAARRFAGSDTRLTVPLSPATSGAVASPAAALTARTSANTGQHPCVRCRCDHPGASAPMAAVAMTERATPASTARRGSISNRTAIAAALGPQSIQGPRTLVSREIP